MIETVEFLEFTEKWAEKNNVDFDNIFEFTEDEDGLACAVPEDFVKDFEKEYNENLDEALNNLLQEIIKEYTD